jgi:glycosyltransferase involved in cell wall biosynthesis
MISIVLGTCNRLAKLQRSLESIANENSSIGNTVEVLVADGGSTDGTLEYLKSKPYGMDLKFIGEGALHGVTRCYNRLFKISKHQLITWTSDDCRYEPGSLLALINRTNSEPEKTLVGCYTDNCDGRGYVNFLDQKCCTIGCAKRSLYELVDFWSEDYVTYASDIDFSVKVNRSGGCIVFEPQAKVFHEMDDKDYLHTINMGENIASQRFSNIFTDASSRRFERTNKTYPDVFISAYNINNLFFLIEKARNEISWGNFYTENDYGHLSLLESMNVQIVNNFNKIDYDMIIDNNGIRLGNM